ncbi:MAG TPA: hypothetical protein VE988_00405 [Gemmataceae bacterium]|nr:hypothetical protein [Gemmataceae bacterium]
MAELSLEKRLAAVEMQVANILAQEKNGAAKKDWRRTIGMFTNDPQMRELFAEAQRIREADRKKARRKQGNKRLKARS